MGCSTSTPSNARLRPDAMRFVLCNPHNPIGKVLTLEEELRLSDLAAQYDVRIFNDEIHAPFVFKGKHIAFPHHQRAGRITVDDRYQRVEIVQYYGHEVRAGAAYQSCGS